MMCIQREQASAPGCEASLSLGGQRLCPHVGEWDVAWVGRAQQPQAKIEEPTVPVQETVL